MRYLQTILFILIFCICTSAQLIVKVIDGDTYKVLLNGRVQTVRLQNVDAPELGQYFGKAASDSVATLIQLHMVQLETQGSDLYGRQLVSIHVNGMSFDSLLIAKGWACFYSSYSHNLQLSIYEAIAKLKGIGLWRCEHPVPPWIWRKLSKRNKRLYEMCR